MEFIVYISVCVLSTYVLSVYFFFVVCTGLVEINVNNNLKDKTHKVNKQLSKRNLIIIIITIKEREKDRSHRKNLIKIAF